ncbi:MAG: ABC transporter permease [Opitutaceae bacterium]|nr:ABC transporter permease [Verrucomicrobiales bacterium]
MRFLSVAERELRAAARQNGLYRLRWITAAGSFALLLWLGWEFRVFQNKGAGPLVFQTFAIVLFVYCLFVGAAGTADCVSRERRDGTLGLLFLTNLNSAGIVAGKLCSNGLALAYSLVATFPIMALPVLIGGVTLGEFWRTVLALLSALVFALASGFVASSVCVRQFPAVALATGLALVLGSGLLGAAEVMRKSGFSPATVETVAMFSPLHTLLSASDRIPISNRQQFWTSLSAVNVLSWMGLGFSAWWMGRTWRDRPKSIRWWRSLDFGHRLRERRRTARLTRRRRLLEVNPFFWLAGRQQVSAPIFMLLTIVLVLLTVNVTAPYFGRIVGGGVVSPLLGHMIAWLFTGLTIHALVLYYAAMVASQRLAEDKQIGALELILSTPLSERSISRGLWLAYARRMFFPALTAMLVHCFFIWQVLMLMVLDPPGKLPLNVTPGQILWSALFEQPLKGQVLDWQFGVILRVIVLTLGGLIASWLMLGWLGRWLGLRMKHPGFAPITAVSLTLVPPALLFSLGCYVGDQSGLSRMPERQLIPLMLWGAVGITFGNCLLLASWAAWRLRCDFRTTITSCHEPRATGSWIRRRRQILARFSVALMALVLMLGLLIGAFFTFQNWQSRRQWAAFQKQLMQRGESLDLSAALPGPVPDGQNFAQSPAFQKFLVRPSADTLLSESLKRSAIDPAAGTGPISITPWMQQKFVQLDQHAAWIDPKFILGSIKDRPTLAATVTDGLKRLQDDLKSVTSATRLPFFQVTTNRTEGDVFESNRMELLVLEQLHFLFQLRACALLAAGRAAEAGEDVLNGLRLATLARQCVDMNSSVRVQFMAGRSLQPVWEGLAMNQWNEPQLAAMQRSLAGFDLLSDHTNAVHRTVRAHIEAWASMAAGQPPRGPVRGVHLRRTDRPWQPDAWLFDNCRQLYQAGQNAIARIDVAAARVDQDYNWSDLNGLSLEGSASQLIQQAPWWGNNFTLVSFAQTSVNQGIIACALERHRLASGAYPNSLDKLKPAFLDQIPRDTSRGLSMFYERKDDNHYVLRGAGVNATIDLKGTPSDDWIWAFTTPTNKPPNPTSGSR